MIAALVNGKFVVESKHAIDVEDRGLAYGDGLFETMLLNGGVVRRLDDHLERLSQSCARLGIDARIDTDLRCDIATISRQHDHGIVKAIVTRGSGGRGFAALPAIKPTRIVILYPAREESNDKTVALCWCSTRLGRNAHLAGMKHLNRLEYVLARREWSDPAIDDGLLLDTEGEVIESTICNLFAVIRGVLTTPDLRFCGVRGVMRRHVLQTARRLGIESEERSVHREEVEAADELFLTNAIRGIRSVRRLDGKEWQLGPITRRLMASLETV